MFGRKHEKIVHQNISEHLCAVCRAVKMMIKSVDAFVHKDFRESDESGYQVHLLEKEADSLRRVIIADLYKGAFFPAIREDIIIYIARQDKIADRAESCCDFMLAQKPVVPEYLAGDILNLARVAGESVEPLENAIPHIFKDDAKVHDAIKAVNTKEEEADTIEWHLTKKIFQSKELSLAEKIHLREMVFHIVQISDVAEDTADMLDTVLLKRSV